MTDVLADSRYSRPTDFLDSRERPIFKDNLPSVGTFAPSFAEEALHAGEVRADDVEGVPLTLVRLYAEIARRHARTREVDPGVWVSTVVGLDGAWGDGDSIEAAEKSLEEAIIGWVAVKRRMGASDIPLMESIDLNHRD